MTRTPSADAITRMQTLVSQAEALWRQLDALKAEFGVPSVLERLTIPADVRDAHAALEERLRRAQREIQESHGQLEDAVEEFNRVLKTCNSFASTLEDDVELPNNCGHLVDIDLADEPVDNSSMTLDAFAELLKGLQVVEPPPGLEEPPEPSPSPEEASPESPDEETGDETDEEREALEAARFERIDTIIKASGMIPQRAPLDPPAETEDGS